MENISLTIDGKNITCPEGQSILVAAENHGIKIPKLCYHHSLKPFGACRLCVVELEGARNPVASCTTKATEGMVVRTKTDAIEKHRKTLLEMVASENREVGTSILMENEQGQTKSFLVTDLDRRSITIDGNNPLAGREVIFEVEIQLVRDATEKEIEYGGKVPEETE